jgi:uncharacterized integral membrane protein
MSDDAGRGRLGGSPPHGSVGPVDPTADPATDPGLRIPVPAERKTGPVALPSSGPATGTAPAVRHSRSGGLWVGLILSALVLLLLLVFILQNDEPVQISFFALEGVLPSGVALLLAAILGILLVAIPGSVRILQLRRAARRRARTER